MECMQNNFNEGVVLGGRYRTVSPINCGSFGMVFRAIDLSRSLTAHPTDVDENVVAIKCLTKKSTVSELPPSPSSFSIDEKSEELEIHSNLGAHENIVNLIDSFSTDAHAYLVLEYCPNGDLYEAIRHANVPVQTDHVREIMLQLLDAVEYMHSRGIYHRDIKPENIFLTTEGSLKLGDFGLATREEWTYETGVGSNRYMSPEQFHSTEGYSSAKADLWAVGICLLNILFARNPFVEPSDDDKAFRAFKVNKESLWDFFDKMTVDTLHVVEQLMALEPENRSLSGARAALQRVVSFTDEPESFDDGFLNITGPVEPSVNREPLRTPSVSQQAGPGLHKDYFEWKKELLTVEPAIPIRQLSTVPDIESYPDEDLMGRSMESKGWSSHGQQTPSLTSGLESSLASMNSLTIQGRALMLPGRANLTPVSSSLPIPISKSKLMPSISNAFGASIAGRSWADETIEYDEEENDRERHVAQRQAHNARTWSNDSNTVTPDDMSHRRDDFAESKNTSLVTLKGLNHLEAHSTPIAKSRASLFKDDFFYKHGDKPALPPTPRYAPPAMRQSPTNDKWAKLGDRRRAYTASASSATVPISRPQQETWRIPRRVVDNQPSTTSTTGAFGGTGFSTFGSGAWDIKGAGAAGQMTSPANYQHKSPATVGACPWDIGRAVATTSRDRDGFWGRERERERNTTQHHLGGLTTSSSSEKKNFNMNVHIINRGAMDAATGIGGGEIEWVGGGNFEEDF